MNHEPSYEHHPMEDMEPEVSNAIVEARKAYRRVLDGALDHIINAKNPLVAAWQAAYALGCPVCYGKSMSTCANELGVQRATISTGAVAFVESMVLPPSPYMYSEEARETHRGIERGKNKGGAA